MAKCPECNGSGRVTKYVLPNVTDLVPCLSCRGTGERLPSAEFKFDRELGDCKDFGPRPMSIQTDDFSREQVEATRKVIETGEAIAATGNPKPFMAAIIVVLYDDGETVGTRISAGTRVRLDPTYMTQVAIDALQKVSRKLTS